MSDKKTILLVEDEKVTAMIETAMLKRNGFFVNHVDSGEQALAFLKSSKKTDLILMDIDLGFGMDGIEAAKKIIALYDLPLIFLSSHTDKNYIEKMEELTSYGFILKNSGEAVLLASIKMAFRLYEEKHKTKYQEKLFMRMLSVIPDMVSIHDKEMNIIYSNWQGIADVPEEERLLNTKCYKTYRGFSEICPDCQAKNVLSTKKPFHVDTELPNGKWIDLRVLPVFRDDNELEYFVEWLRDITDLKKTETDLIKTQQKSEALLDAIPDLMFVFDSDYRLLDYHSRYKEEKLYFNPKLALGKTLDNFIDSENLLQIQKSIDFVLRYQKPVFNTFDLETGNKKQYYEARYFEFGQNEVLAIIRNITESKLSKINNEKLQNQLNHSQKMESVGRLAGGVAHDINNMLSVIIGFTELALFEVNEAHSLYHNLQEILKSAMKSSNIVRQLLAFARKQAISPKIIDLNEIVKDTKKMLARLIGENINFKLITEKTPLTIKVDPTQIDQVLANLCVNAKDAIADTGSIIVETSVFHCDKEYCSTHSDANIGKYALLTVSDNGTGIDKINLQHIFEPFYTSKELGKGTGLGLATVYGIVKQNNGFIEVYSELGQGTTFKIYLPIFDKKIEKEKSTEVEKNTFMGNETILLVEDELALLNMIGSMLKAHGYNIIGTTSAKEAIKLAEKNKDKIDLCITDVIMPEMNGKTLMDIILKTIPNVKSIFMSGYTDNIIQSYGIYSDDVKFIQKPFNINEFVKIVREVLD